MATKAQIMAGIRARAIAKGKKPSAADVLATFNKYRTASGAKRPTPRKSGVVSGRFAVDVANSSYAATRTATARTAPRPIPPSVRSRSAEARAAVAAGMPPALGSRSATARSRTSPLSGRPISGPDKPPTRPGGYGTKPPAPKGVPVGFRRLPVQPMPPTVKAMAASPLASTKSKRRVM